jgi:hypothetical protein
MPLKDHRYNDLEGKGVTHLLPYGFRYANEASSQMRLLKRYLEDGGKVHIEFTTGARKGSIGRLVISAEICDTLYPETPSTSISYRAFCQQKEWEIVWDDRTSKVNVQIDALQRCWKGMVLRLDLDETFWAFSKKDPAPPKPKKIWKDHFGRDLEVGQMILFPYGYKADLSNRFGFIEAISDAGTVKVKLIKTRDGHNDDVINMSPGVAKSNIIVIPKGMDMNGEIMKARLGA